MTRLMEIFLMMLQIFCLRVNFAIEWMWANSRACIYPHSCALLRVFLFKMNQFDYISVLDWHISRYVRSFSNINQKIFLLKRKFSIFKLILGLWKRILMLCSYNINYGDWKLFNFTLHNLWCLIFLESM